MSTFENLLNDTIAPMFPGLSIIQTEYKPGNASRAVVSMTNGGSKLRVRESSKETQYYELSRKQPFDVSEKGLIEILINSYSKVRNEAPDYLMQLEDLIVRRAIAQSISEDDKQAEVVTCILDKFSKWSTETYEGERVSAGVVTSNAGLESEVDK